MRKNANNQRPNGSSARTTRGSRPNNKKNKTYAAFKNKGGNAPKGGNAAKSAKQKQAKRQQDLSTRQNKRPQGKQANANAKSSREKLN